MRLANIFNLGVKELRSLRRDPIMVVLIVYAFTLAVIIAADAMPETLHNAPIAIVDEDHSHLSSRIVDAFYPPLFATPGTDQLVPKWTPAWTPGASPLLSTFPRISSATCWPVTGPGFSSISTPPG